MWNYEITFYTNFKDFFNSKGVAVDKFVANFFDRYWGPIFVKSQENTCIIQLQFFKYT